VGAKPEPRSITAENEPRIARIAPALHSVRSAGTVGGSPAC